MPEIVFDSCVLSNFALAKAIPVLERLYSRSAFVTDFVAAEIMRGIQKGYAGLECIKSSLQAGRIRETVLETDAEKDLFEKSSVSLGLGEASSIAVAKKRGWTFASDDRLARKEASSIGVRLTGTIGILVKAIKIKHLTIKEADEVLAVMIEKGFYSPVEFLRSI
jgi:predicted nucleic acid-binding protein